MGEIRMQKADNMMDVQQALDRGDDYTLQQVWDAYDARRTWLQVLAKATDQEGERVAREALAKLPQVNPAQALQANAKLVDALTGRRWYVIQDMREAGESWTVVGKALGMTKQAAWEWYRAKIDLQAKYVPDFHDTARSHAVLEE
ncbi:MAG: hypothetical protein ACRDQA_31770 [Nocardioidaceae bacterium]